MEGEGARPPESEEFKASIHQSREENRNRNNEAVPGMEEHAQPEVLPVPPGSLNDQMRYMKLPENVQLALRARIPKENDIHTLSFKTPDLLMRAHGKEEWAVTRALDALDRYGIHTKTPEMNDVIDTVGIDNARLDRLKQSGIATFGQLVELLHDSKGWERIDPRDRPLIAHRLNHFGLMDKPSVS